MWCCPQNVCVNYARIASIHYLSPAVICITSLRPLFETLKDFSNRLTFITIYRSLDHGVATILQGGAGLLYYCNLIVLLNARLPGLRACSTEFTEKYNGKP